MLNAPRRDHRYLLIGPLALAVGMACAFIPHMTAHGGALGSDYARYFTAAHFLVQGRNPYNQLALLRASRSLTDLSVARALATSDGFVLLPFVLWPILLLARLPFWWSYAVLTGFAIVAFASSTALLARGLGWRRWWIPALLSCFLWAFVWGRIVGQLDFVIPISLIAACFLLARGHTYLAGAVLTGIWVQPELTWVAGMAMVILLLGDRRRLVQTLLGFAVWSVVLFGISSAASHGILMDWLRGGSVFVNREGTHEADLLGFPALIQLLDPSQYKLYAVSSAPTLAVAAAGVVAAVHSGVWMTRSRAIASLPPFEQRLWQLLLPLSIWVLVSPYGHPNNAVVLIPLAITIVGPDARRVASSRLDMSLLGGALIVDQFFTGTVLFPDLMPLATGLLLLVGFRRLRQMEGVADLRLCTVGGGEAQPHPATYL